MLTGVLKSQKVIGLLSIPWCCVITMASVLLVGASSIGAWVDGLFHVFLPFLMLLHVAGIALYVWRGKKDRQKTAFLVFSTALFLFSVGFHFTPAHDVLLHGDHDHQVIPGYDFPFPDDHNH